MFKHLIIFSTIVVLGGCETINQTNQCDPAKNYIISNPQAMEDYKKKIINKEKVSLYENIKQSCNSNSCIFYDSEKFKFVERNFNNLEMNGVYKITQIENNNNCVGNSKKIINDKCYLLEKNELGEINSDYEFTMQSIGGNMNIIFKNLKTKEELYNVSYQTYSTKALGGPGYSYCSKQYKNNPHYKFHVTDFVNGDF